MSGYATIFSPLPSVAELGQGQLPPRDEKLWATFCHLGALLGLGFLAPLVIFLIQRDQSPFVASHAKEALNFQITYLIIIAACIFLMWLVIPFFLVMAFGILAIVVGILASIRANEGGFMSLPFTIRFIK